MAKVKKDSNGEELEPKPKMSNRDIYYARVSNHLQLLEQQLEMCNARTLTASNFQTEHACSELFTTMSQQFITLLLEG